MSHLNELATTAERLMKDVQTMGQVDTKNAHLWAAISSRLRPVMLVLEMAKELASSDPYSGPTLLAAELEKISELLKEYAPAAKQE